MVCLQTYNTRIMGIEDRKVESISLALEVLVQEIGVPEFIACDLEGSFQKLEKLLHKKELEELEARHQVQFRFSAPTLTSPQG